MACLVAALVVSTAAFAGAWAPWGPEGIFNPPRPPYVALHPTQPNVWLAARQGSGFANSGLFVYGSVDGGATWPRRAFIDHYNESEDVQVALAGNYGYLRESHSSLYRSQDGGMAWTPLSRRLPIGMRNIVGANPHDDAELVLVGMDGAVYRSLDAGSTWASFSVPIYAGFGAIDWTTRRIYVAGLGGAETIVVSKALDSGSVWAPGPVADQALAASSGNALAASRQQLWYSPDAGLSWSPRTVDGVDFRAAALAYAPTAPSIAYGIERTDEVELARVIRSTDGGASWTVVGTVPDRGGGIPALAVEAGAGDRLGYSGEHGVYRSIDAGASWTYLARSGDFPATTTFDVLFDASVPGVRWVRAPTRTPRSVDAGVSWDASGAFANGQPLPVATSPTRSGLVFGTVPSVGDTRTMVRSLDGGGTWAPSLAFARVDGDNMPTVLAGEASLEYFTFVNETTSFSPGTPKVYRSVDEGATWTPRAAPSTLMLSVARTPDSPVLLYAGVDSPVGLIGLFKSSDQASTWQAVPMGEASGPVTVIAVAPTNRNRIVVALADPNGPHLLRSDDAGGTWAPAWVAMPTTRILALAIDPANPSIMYAGTYGQGIFRSADAGATWMALDQGLGDKRIRGLVFDPRDSTKLYAATDTGPYLVDLATGIPTGNRSAIEYYHAEFDHYFVSADLDEIAGLDAGVFQGWARTGESFRAGPTPSPDQAPVCRFFGVGFAPLSSHFYTPYPGECAIVKQDPKWFYEKFAFGLRLPEANKGCLPGHAPLYRLWNRNSEGAPNHRYTTSLVTFDLMFANGWVMEGEADTFVFACVPQ